MKKLLVALAAIVSGSVFADTVTLSTADAWDGYKEDGKTTICSWVDGEHWSDGLPPHSDADYVVNGKQLIIQNKVLGGTTFAGNSLKIETNGSVYLWWDKYSDGNWTSYPVNFGDITLTGGNSKIYVENSANAANGLVTYLLRGNLTVTGVKNAWPARFELPKVSGGWIVNEMKMIGSSTAYLLVRTLNNVNGMSALPDANDPTKISETGLVGVDFNGDNSEFLGEIMAGTNVAIRVGNSLPSKVTLPNRWSAIGCTGKDEVEIETVEFMNEGILLASDKYKVLKVNNLVKNGVITVRPYDFTNAGFMMAEKIDILKVPLATGLTEDDFYFDYDQEGFSLELTADEEYQTLSIVNADPIASFDPTGYVTLTRDDPDKYSLEDYSLYSYHYAGGWSDGEKPTADKDYYVGPGYRMLFNNRGEVAIARDGDEGLGAGAYWCHIQFRGRSLVIGGTALFNSVSSSTGYSLDIADLKLLSGSNFTDTQKDNSVSANSVKFGHNTGRCTTTITILADKRLPTVWEGGKISYTTNKDQSITTNIFGYILGEASKLVGDANSGIRLIGERQYGLGNPNAQSYVALNGDMSQFFGTFMVEGNQTLKIGKSMPGTVEMVDTTYGFLSFEEAKGEISLGKLVTKGAMEFEIPAAMTGLIIGGVKLGGNLNIIDPNFVNGKIKLGKVTGDYTVTVNGESIGMLSNGILYTGEKEAFMASLKIAGEGTVYEPYILDTIAKAKVLQGTDENYIIVFDAPLNGEDNNNRKTDYINNWRALFVDNYNSANDAKFPSDNSGEAYTNVGYTVRDPNRWEWFWSDKQAPHAGSEYVLYPEVWGKNHYTKSIKITGDMQAPFAGDSLTVGLNWWLYFTQNTSRGDIKKLVMLPDSGINQYEAIKEENKLLGTTYIRGYENHPVRLSVEKGAKLFAFEGTLVSEPTGLLQLEAVTSLAAAFNGDMLGYRGKIVASTNSTIKIGATAEKATFEVLPEGVGIIVANAATVKAVSMAEGKTLTLNAPLTVADSFTLQGAITVDVAGIEVGEEEVAVLQTLATDLVGKVTVVGMADDIDAEVGEDGKIVLKKATYFAGEAGTEEDPYIIDEAADLVLLSEYLTAGKNLDGKFFKQTANITLTEWTGIGINNAGSQSTNPFEGVYDGNGKTITVTFSTDTSLKYAGLFNTTGAATIKNLMVEVVGEVTYKGVAGLIGYANGTTIQGVTVNGTISGTHNCAGFAVKGENCAFDSCTNNATIYTTYTKAGGFVAFTQDVDGLLLKNCVNNGNVTIVNSTHSGDRGIGGLVGWAMTTMAIENCVNNGVVTWEGDEAAGPFVGGYGKDGGTAEITLTITGWEGPGKAYGTKLNEVATIVGGEDPTPAVEAEVGKTYFDGDKFVIEFTGTPGAYVLKKAASLAEPIEWAEDEDAEFGENKVSTPVSGAAGFYKLEIK